MSDKRFLSEVSAVILEQGLGKARAQILQKQLENRGGKVEKKVSQGTTHILVGKTTRLSRIPNLLKIKSIPEGVLVLRADWLSACLVEAEIVGHGAYVVHPEPSPTASPSKNSQLSQGSPGKASSTLPAAVSTPRKEKATVKLSSSPSTAASQVVVAGESKSADSSSKMPTTPPRPTASLTSPKVLMILMR